MLGLSPISSAPISALAMSGVVTDPPPVDAEPPDAPTIGSAFAGAGVAVVSFTPGADGGAPVTVFTLYASTGQTATGTSSPIAIGLPPGIAVTFTVKATNEAGEGPASAASNSVTPTVPVVGASRTMKRARTGRRHFS